MTPPDDSLSAIRSLGTRSDLLVLRGVSETELHDDRVVLRTPGEPNYWCGNMVIFRGAVVDPVPQIARFHADFPEAAHVAISWDTHDMVIGPEHAPLSDLGFRLEQTDVLSLTGALCRAPVPDGIVLRPVEREAEWQRVIALQTATGLEEGYERASYEPYVRGRFLNRRKQVAEGWASWIGAFEGDLLVGDLGIYVDCGVARFQDVETRQSHRRRGICAALVAAGVDWAASRDRGAVPVIEALSDGPAGRIYRRRGFGLSETHVLALRPPAGT